LIDASGNGWSWRLLRAGGFRLDGGAMFGIIPKPLWVKLVEPDDRNRIPLEQNCLLLERSGSLALIECGIGDKFPKKLRDIYAQEDRTIVDALHEADCDPKDIDTVVVTHLHFDHAGGLTRWGPDGETPELNFPNAEVVAQRLEWEDALANRSTMHKTYLREHLEPIRERVRLIEGEAEILPGMRAIPVPGHTWGQQAVAFEAADGGTVCYPGDVMPTANHVGAAFNLAYDVEPYTNMGSKSMLLGRASEGAWTLALDHEPGPPLWRAEPSREKPGQYTLTEAPVAGALG
jgi:glyoxylase-like metal-dependent hydrolase (beta-lactamase superfamily II)